MRRASPLARRAIPNCQTDGSLPGAEPVLLPSTPAPPPSPSAPAPSPPLYGEPPAPRADRPRKSRLYWKRSGPRDYRVFIIHAIDACSKGRERNLERIKLLSTTQSDWEWIVEATLFFIYSISILAIVLNWARVKGVLRDELMRWTRNIWIFFFFGTEIEFPKDRIDEL